MAFERMAHSLHIAEALQSLTKGCMCACTGSGHKNSPTAVGALGAQHGAAAGGAKRGAAGLGCGRIAPGRSGYTPPTCRAAGALLQVRGRSAQALCMPKILDVKQLPSSFHNFAWSGVSHAVSQYCVDSGLGLKHDMLPAQVLMMQQLWT